MFQNEVLNIILFSHHINVHLWFLYLKYCFAHLYVLEPQFSDLVNWNLEVDVMSEFELLSLVKIGKWLDSRNIINIPDRNH